MYKKIKAQEKELFSNQSLCTLPFVLLILPTICRTQRHLRGTLSPMPQISNIDSRNVEKVRVLYEFMDISRLMH